MASRIMVCIDGSENSRRAFDKSIDIATRFSPPAVLILVHIFQQEAYNINGVGPETDALVQNIRFKMDEAKDLLNFYKNICDESELQCNLIVKETHNSIKNEIIKQIEENQPNLVIIGSRGLSKLKSLILGSVSEHIINHSNCNVLIIH